MSKLIETTVLKPHMGPNGVIVQRGDTIRLDERRHKLLMKKGYVPDPDTPQHPSEEDGKVSGVLTNRSFEKRRTKIISTSAED